jgi:hypothetical protein
MLPSVAIPKHLFESSVDHECLKRPRDGFESASCAITSCQHVMIANCIDPEPLRFSVYVESVCPGGTYTGSGAFSAIPEAGSAGFCCRTVCRSADVHQALCGRLQHRVAHRQQPHSRCRLDDSCLGALPSALDLKEPIRSSWLSVILIECRS